MIMMSTGTESSDPSRTQRPGASGSMVIVICDRTRIQRTASPIAITFGPDSDRQAHQPEGYWAGGPLDSGAIAELVLVAAAASARPGGGPGSALTQTQEAQAQAERSVTPQESEARA